MYTAKRKIQKDHDAEPTEFEETVAQVGHFYCFLNLFDSYSLVLECKLVMFCFSAGIV